MTNTATTTATPAYNDQMTSAQLLVVHNDLAARIDGANDLASWSKAKSLLIERIDALVAQLPKAARGGIRGKIRDMLKNTDSTYAQIVDAVKAEFPNARTTTRSVAWEANDMRKAGEDVAYRRRSRSTTNATTSNDTDAATTSMAA